MFLLSVRWNCERSLSAVCARAGARGAGVAAGRASNRRDRLQRALWLLQQGGITRSYAYSPLFRGLARIGVIIKPVHTVAAQTVTVSVIS